MADPWRALLWLVGSLTALILLSRWLNRHVQGIILLLSGSIDAVIYISFLVLLPGILLHELSHWAVAILLGVRARKLTLIPRKGRGQQVHYGSVEIEATDPFRSSLIGVAPLIVGSSVILLGSWLGLGLEPLHMPASWQEAVSYWTASDALLWGYVIFAISNAMLPSQSDRRPWRPVILFLLALLTLLAATNLLAKVPPALTALGLNVVLHLAYAFTLTIIVDLFVAVIIWLLEQLLSLLLGRRVEY